MRHKPQLSAGVGRRAVGSNVPKDVFVTQQYGRIDLRLTSPRVLVAGEENLDGHEVSVPTAFPDFAIAAFA